ncbi:hypothetical protein AcW1_009306 [Taiwanofungus camphoratus]|nr:hypothetical protein AcW1_009306 [Antrodia cinnamomea]
MGAFACGGAGAAPAARHRCLGAFRGSESPSWKAGEGRVSFYVGDPDPGPRSGAGRGVLIFVFDPEFGGGRVRRYRTYTPSSPLRASGPQGPRALLTALRPASPQRDVFYPTNRSLGCLSPQEPVGQGSRGDPQRRGGNPFVLARRRRWERAARGQIAAGHGGGVPEHTRSAPWLLWARATTACARGRRVRGCEGVPESRGSGGPASVAIPRAPVFFTGHARCLASDALTTEHRSVQVQELSANRAQRR